MITISFDFKNRKASDLRQLNALLATMKLKDLDLEDMQGYLAVSKDGDGNLLHKRYGLDSGTLVCKLAGSGQATTIRSIPSLLTRRSIMMERQPDESFDLFQVSGSGPSSDLYDQCH